MLNTLEIKTLKNILHQFFYTVVTEISHTSLACMIYLFIEKRLYFFGYFVKFVAYK